MSTDFERGTFRIVELKNVNDDDQQSAPVYVPEVPNDVEERAADLKKFSR